MITVVLIFGIVWLRGGLLGNFTGINAPARHAILFVGPATKVDQLAALRTKRTPGVVLPFDWFITRRTLPHNGKLRRKSRNVKGLVIISRVSGEIFMEIDELFSFCASEAKPRFRFARKMFQAAGVL